MVDKLSIDVYEVYTDGACANNQGSGGQPGGWGAAFLDGRKYSGGHPETTNNRMELTAVIEALKNTPKESKVIIYSDSAYVVNAFKQKWLDNWVKKGWKTSQGKAVENQDLWKELLPLTSERKVDWVKVKGHSGNKWNEIADKLAVNAIPTGNDKENIEKDEYMDTEKMITISISKEKYNHLLKTLKLLADKYEDFQDLYNEILNSQKE